MILVYGMYKFSVPNRTKLPWVRFRCKRLIPSVGCYSTTLFSTPRESTNESPSTQELKVYQDVHLSVGVASHEQVPQVVVVELLRSPRSTRSSPQIPSRSLLLHPTAGPFPFAAPATATPPCGGYAGGLSSGGLRHRGYRGGGWDPGGRRWRHGGWIIGDKRRRRSRCRRYHRGEDNWSQQLRQAPARGRTRCPSFFIK